jgi:hypothetical protein
MSGFRNVFQNLGIYLKLEAPEGSHEAKYYVSQYKIQSPDINELILCVHIL